MDMDDTSQASQPLLMRRSSFRPAWAKNKNNKTTFRMLFGALLVIGGVTALLILRWQSPVKTWKLLMDQSRDEWQRRPETINDGLLGEIRINHMQVVGTHNSYHRETHSPKACLLENLGIPGSLKYSHASLTHQLSSQGVRSLELDLYPDPDGGAYAGLYRRMFGGHQSEKYQIMKQPGTKVMHIPGTDGRTSCLTLISCLTELRSWSLSNPHHVPISIILELKALQLGRHYLGRSDLKWSTKNLDTLDSEVRSIFSPSQLITPDDVRGDHDDLTLEQAVTTHGWPTLEESRGKFFFLMDNNVTHPMRGNYRADNRTNLEGRVIFTNSIPGESDAAFIKLNSPQGGNLDLIQDIVRQGYIVRTRADVDSKAPTNRGFDRMNRAFKSGAQVVSTDWPGVGMAARYESDYVVQLPDGGTARCNPVLTPQFCENDLL